VKQAELEENTGAPDLVDLHPLITCAPHIMDGHAHLKQKQVTVERILIALMLERGRRDLRLANGMIISGAEVAATYKYSIDIFDNISKLYAEIGRLREMFAGEPRKGGART
jgi:uncharacterized protein (DUF433 family)